MLAQVSPLPASGGLIAVAAALAAFALIGLRAGRRIGSRDADAYLTARGTQGTGALALSLFASVVGTWILLSPAEVGTFAGVAGVAGYAVGQAAALAVFAVVGPAVASRLPEGTTILQWVRLRYGRAMQSYAGGVSVLYMAVFLIAELTGVGLVVDLLAGVPPVPTIALVALVTVAYTAYGGLPASIATDRWQAWLTVALAAAGAVALGIHVEDPVGRARVAGLTEPTRLGAEVAVVLVVAIIAANLFHQGFWQRVWSARDRRSIVGGSLGAAALSFPLLALTGFAGMVAAGGDGVDVPSTAFFTLLTGLPAVALIVVAVLAVTLVASTVDTLENALASLVAVDVSGGRMGIGAARWVTVAITAVAAAIASAGLSVLRLFLIADLLAATIAVPVFAGLSRRTTAAGALAGSASGLAGIVVLGWIRGGNPSDGLWLLTLPGGPTIGPFVVAVVASSAVTLLASLVARPVVGRFSR